MIISKSKGKIGGKVRQIGRNRGYSRTFSPPWQWFYLRFGYFRLSFRLFLPKNSEIGAKLLSLVRNFVLKFLGRVAEG